jgi:hypothetical protein
MIWSFNHQSSFISDTHQLASNNGVNEMVADYGYDERIVVSASFEILFFSVRNFYFVDDYFGGISSHHNHHDDDDEKKFHSWQQWRPITLPLSSRSKNCFVLIPVSFLLLFTCDVDDNGAIGAKS